VAEWYGGLFDVWSRARVLTAGCEVEFDAILPNGRDSDMRANIRGRHVRLESTVIGESDEDRGSFENFLQVKRQDPNATWWRPGPCDPPGARSPSLYYNSFRLYTKAYDKIAKNLDPEKSQCAADEPNVLLVSFSGAFVHPEKPGWEWALRELLDAQPNVCAYARIPPHLPDVSLHRWVTFTIQDLARRGVLSPEEYENRRRDYHRIMSAPRRLGGIVVFKNCKLATARINYNALDECAVTHAEMAELERIFAVPCSYAI
jgi:hypothetical protein